MRNVRKTEHQFARKIEREPVAVLTWELKKFRKAKRTLGGGAPAIGKEEIFA